MTPLRRIPSISWPLLACLLLACSATPPPASPLCHYETWAWSTLERRAENHERVVKDRATLTAEERGSVEGCTVCEEDQAELALPGLPPTRVCRRLRDRFRAALEASVRAGFPVRTLTGYRVGRSKGEVDEAGRRVGFSNHSYGVALDVNAETNGLYDDCPAFSARCRLLRGGAYRPGQRGVIDHESPLFLEMRKQGFRWGGDLEGKQKDFMHFSLSGA